MPPEPSADALNRILSTLRLKPQMFERMELDGPWQISLSSRHRAAFHLVEAGTCWIRIPGRDPLHLTAGDLVVVANCEHYELAGQASSPALPTHERAAQGGAAPDLTSSPPKTILIYGEFRSDYDVVSPLFLLMPPLIYIDSTSGLGADWLAGPLKIITREAQNAYPGHELVISRLTDVLFVMVLRYWIAHHLNGDGGWIAALYHPQMGNILGQMHQYPERQWTVELLAQMANMSRSTFVARFQDLVGEAPMRYLTLLRIHFAMMWLIEFQDATVEDIAHRVGYTSAYAFSRAFKRIAGLAPADYRRTARRESGDGKGRAARTAQPVR